MTGQPIAIAVLAMSTSDIEVAPSRSRRSTTTLPPPEMRSSHYAKRCTGVTKTTCCGECNVIYSAMVLCEATNGRYTWVAVNSASAGWLVASQYR
jgi:hypothetical protein